ncbi:hypothetical protein VKT23_011528 [Stygiomarasmius scandens]|uniref:Uncharacterized protein n=1 Tax=Marasmiellus scandens TaxID=2682957 RepID=A0ABR1JBU7_9AGAR
MRSSATLLILLLCTVFRASYALPAATNTTSQAPQPTSTQGLTCPVLSNTVATANTRTITPRGLSLFDTFTSLFRRQGGSEFVGWHGTTGVNACRYTNSGRMGGSIPVLDQFNGADAELGPGLYVTDDITTARVFALTTANARRNAGVTDPLALLPTVCKVEAISQMNWRNNVPQILDTFC